MKKPGFWTVFLAVWILAGICAIFLVNSNLKSPLAQLPSTFEAEVTSGLYQDSLSVLVLGQKYTGSLSLDIKGKTLPKLSKGFRVQVTLDPEDPPQDRKYSYRLADLQILAYPSDVTDHREQQLTGIVIVDEYSLTEIKTDTGNYSFDPEGTVHRTYELGDLIQVSYFPGSNPTQLDYLTDVRLLEKADWGIQLEVLEVSAYQLKLRIRSNEDFPFPLTVDNTIGIYLPRETLPYSISCSPLEETTERSYTLSGDDIFIVDFGNFFAPLRWSGTYVLEKTVCRGSSKQSYTVSFTYSAPNPNLGEGKPWPG